jgi:parallel beta-helix repeat protein
MLAGITLVALVLTVAGTPSAGAVPITFSAEADAYVNESTPTTNYGASTTLRLDSSPILRTYLRFNVQGLAEPATSATLRIFANSSQTVGFSVHDLPDDSWTENAITYATAPVHSPDVIASSGPVTAGTWYELNVTSLVTGNGPVSVALTTTHTTALSLGSRESTNGPQLVVDAVPATPTPPPTPTATPTPTPEPTPEPTPVPTPGGPTPTPIAGRLTVISRSGDTYFADAQWGGSDYTDTSLKTVGEGALYDLNAAGGGTIVFEAGIFDLGPDFFYLREVANLEFRGQGMDVTVLQNNTNAPEDTEPFNVGFGESLVVRDMTVSAGGTLRTTSDALDFDSTNNSVVERVKVTASRARGIIFDGKGSGGVEANNNVIKDCVVTGTQSHGIQLLAADNNHIENCLVSNVNGYGIQVSKSSASASTPNEKSNDNVIIGNTIQNALTDGINVLSSDRNQIMYNSISEGGRDGIRLDATNSINCNDNIVFGNTLSNNSSWGININSALCVGNTVGANVFSGNGSGTFRNNGTGTQTATPTPTPVPTASPTPEPSATPPPVVTTSLFSCSSTAPVTTASGDNNGFEFTPLNGCPDGDGLALDFNSGTGAPHTCSSPTKDRHTFDGYGIALPFGATVLGIEVRLDARANSSNGNPRMCVELSWDGGATWTAALETENLSIFEETYILGGTNNSWGHSWTPGELADGAFRLRVTDRSQNSGRDFFLDWAAVRVTYQP